MKNHTRAYILSVFYTYIHSNVDKIRLFVHILALQNKIIVYTLGKEN